MLCNFLRNFFFEKLLGGVWGTPKVGQLQYEKSKKIYNFHIFPQICFLANYLRYIHQKQYSCKIWGLYLKN